MTNENRVQKGVPTGGQFATSEKADTGDLTVEAPLKAKSLRRHPWDPDSEVTVQLREKSTEPGSRSFEVLDDTGEPLGHIQEFYSEIDTKIPGSRLVRRGKRRLFWAAGFPGQGSRLRVKRESQAEAIRDLLPND